MGTSHVSWILCQIVICLILLVATAIPCLKTLAKSLSGYRILMTSGHLLQEVGTGIVVAFLAALLAYTGALTLLEANSRYRPWIAWLSCLPGMFGSLTLSLVLISVLYGGYANTYYGSYVPWIVALALTMVPKSLFLAILVDVAVVRTSTHVAKMCGVMSNGKYSRKSTQFAWALYGRRHVAALMLVAYLSYLDLPAAAILGPPNAVPAPVRLYNLMHYGHSQLLSAMIVAAFVMPAMLAIAVIVALNLALRIGHRR